MNYIFVEFVKRIGMKKVLLLPNNTDLNRGDQALVWESIRLIEDIYNRVCLLNSNQAHNFICGPSG